MTTPFKLTILQALTDTLKTITPANGYHSDLSDYDPGDGVMTPRVYRGRAFFGDNDPVPMVSVLEQIGDPDTLVDQLATTPFSEYSWPLIVQGWVKDDSQNPTDPAYYLLADVRQRLAIEAKRRTADKTESHIFGLPWTMVTGLKFGTGIVRPSSEVSAYAGFHLTVEVQICDNAEKQYV